MCELELISGHRSVVVSLLFFTSARGLELNVWTLQSAREAGCLSAVPPAEPGHVSPGITTTRGFSQFCFFETQFHVDTVLFTSRPKPLCCSAVTY